LDSISLRCRGPFVIGQFDRVSAARRMALP
jgi:hypothetical protein